MKNLTRTTLVSALVSLLTPVVGTAEVLLLSESGKARYDIVLGGDPATDAEQFAYMELREHLNRVIGAERRTGERFAHKMNFEGMHKGPRNIFLGWTDFAREHGVDPESLGPEEYVIRAVDEDVMIVGGRPRGTLYGVYDFLENQAGVVFAAPGETVIPEKPDLAVEADLDVQRSPEISNRGTSRRFRTFLPDELTRYETTLWRVRNRENQPASSLLSSAAPPIRSSRYPIKARNSLALGVNPDNLPLIDWNQTYPLWKADPFGGFKRRAQPMHTTFSLLPPHKYQEANPEFYSMRDGEWMTNLSTSNNARGEINFSNRESRPIVAENLMEQIAETHTASRRLGIDPENIFILSQMDNNDASEDPETLRLIREKYGKHSGVMLEYVNEVAELVADRHPDVFIKTFAYLFTMDPPRNIRAAENVIVQWINWYGGPYGSPDLTRSLAHEANALRTQSLRQWGELSEQIGIWDYYFFPNDYPYSAFNRIAGDFPLFDEANVDLIFVQIDMGEDSGAIEGPWVWGHFFFELETWLAYQLMDRPRADADKLADRFIEAYYGAGAPAIKRAHQLLREGDAQPRERLQRVDRRFHRFPYLTPQFFADLDEQLAEAEQAVTGDPERARRVRRLRVKLDMSLLVYWGELADQLPEGESMPFDYEVVIERLRENGLAVIESDYVNETVRNHVTRNLNRRLDYYSSTGPGTTGAEVGNRIDIPSWKFVPQSNWILKDAREYRNDPLSNVGQAEVYTGEAMKTIGDGLRIGFDGDGFEGLIPLGKLTPSGYTRVRVGQTSLNHTNRVWIQDPRFVVDIDVLPIRSGGDTANVVEVFVSLRVDTDENVILVESVQLERVPENEIEPRLQTFLEDSVE